MITFTFTASIQRSPNTIFTYLTDLDKHREPLFAHMEVQPLQGKTSKSNGDKKLINEVPMDYTITGSLGVGMQIIAIPAKNAPYYITAPSYYKSITEITAYDPPHFIAVSIHDAIPMTWWMSFESLQKGTRLTLSVEIDESVILEIARQRWVEIAKQRVEATLSKIVVKIESETVDGN